MASFLRRIAFGAVLLSLALAGQGVSSVSTVSSARPAVVDRSIIGASVASSGSADLRDPGRVSKAPAVSLAPPVRLLIPALGIDAPVEALGVDGTGAMATPENIWNAGWYNRGPSPGEPGDAVIDGHVGLPGSPLVFSGLAGLAIGSEVIAVLADGTRSLFSVTAAQTWPAGAHPPGLFSAEGQARLSMITCTGRYDRVSRTYADRLIVEATYVGAI